MTESKDYFITQLGKDNVLIGRGTGPNTNVGNIRFRELIYARKTEYLAHDHKNKNLIVREIIGIVQSRGGKFVKRMVAAKGNASVKYELVDENTVLEKAKQALQQNRTGQK